jgi:hypothetical protein
MRTIWLSGPVLLALALAGCGGSSPTSGGTTGSGGSGSSSLSGQVVAYAACIRSHGVPDFPDPKVSSSGHEVRMAVPASVGTNPHFKSAQQACRSLAPGGEPGAHPISPQEQAQYLRLAACIRSHGVPNFPDPTFSEGGVHLPQGSVNPRSPQVRAAEQACRSLIPASVRGGS